MEDERTPWWVWVPALPKPIIAAAWAVFWTLSTVAPFIRHLAVPGQAWWLDTWHGLGGNAIGVFSWGILAIQLTTEIVYMIFTFRANKKAVEVAATRNRKEGREEGHLERDAMWQSWVDQIKDKPPEEWPPPPNLENDKGNGHTGN